MQLANIASSLVAQPIHFLAVRKSLPFAVNFTRVKVQIWTGQTDTQSSMVEIPVTDTYKNEPVTRDSHPGGVRPDRMPFRPWWDTVAPHM